MLMGQNSPTRNLVMPDQNGQLNKEEKQKITAWLDEKGVNHSCPVCTKNKWTLGDHLISGMVHTGSGVSIGGAAYPTAFLVCTNCAYTRHFMAVPMGLLEARPEEKSNG